MNYHRDSENLVKRLMAMSWQGAPDHVLERALVRTASEPLPLCEDERTQTRSLPDDVRGLAAKSQASSLSVHRFDDAEINLMLQAAASNGLTTVRGSVWLEGRSIQRIRVALIEDDCVLSVREVSDGEEFIMHELLGSSWRLEVHLPDGKALVISDEENA